MEALRDLKSIERYTAVGENTTFTLIGFLPLSWCVTIDRP